MTKETVGMIFCLFGGLLLIVLLTGKGLFGELGASVVHFLLGVMGYLSYPFAAGLLFVGVLLVKGKQLHIPVKYWGSLTGAVFFLCCIIHTATSVSLKAESFGIYLSSCFLAGEGGLSGTTFGGALLALVVYPLLRYTAAVGAYVIFSVLMLVCAGAFAYCVRARRGEENTPRREKQLKRAKTPKQKPVRVQMPEQTEGPIQPVPVVSEDYTQQSLGSVPASYPKPDIRPVRDPNGELMPHSEGYQRSVANLDAKVQEILRRKEAEDSAQAYVSPVEDPESEYQRRNRRFYENAEQVLGRPQEINASAPKLFDTLPSRAPSAYAPSEPATFEPAPPVQPADGMSILYPGREYAKKSYQTNLIFDSNSKFNNRKTVPSSSHGGYKPVATYGESYVSDLGATASGLPRKIVTDTTVEKQKPYYLQDRDDRRTVEGVSFQGRDLFSSPYGEERAGAAMREDNFRPISSREAQGANAREDAFRPISSREAQGANARAQGANAREDAFRPISSREAQGANAREDAFRPISARETQGARQERGQAESDVPPFDGGSSRQTDALSFESRSAQRPREERQIERPAFEDMRTDGTAGRVGAQPRKTDRAERSDPLSLSSIFSSSSNDTGRIQFDPSRVEKFRGRSAEDLAKNRGTQASTRAEMFDDVSAPAEAPAEPTGVFGKELGNIEPPKRAVPKAALRKYKKPPLEIFEKYQETFGADPVEIKRNSEIIVNTLKDFRIETQVMKVTSGPTVTRYDIEIPPGIQARKIMAYDEDIARKLHVQGGVTIYSNFESGYISIEVPNKKRATVGLASILSDKSFVDAKPTALMFGMGKDVNGRAICGNIAKMTHILVAGSTGSGKSVFLNALIISLIMKYSPEELRLILVDPKQVEFVGYRNLPHLMINEIVNDPERVMNVLDWAIEEMKRRYTLFQERILMGNKLVRDIDEYNDALSPDEARLPKIVIIVDELADLMLRAKKEIEDRIQNLTQKSRAAGIHLVIATQRPSVDVITGIIKSNLPTRVAFRVAQEVDSRTILDDSGAEKLLGYGDMLYKTADTPAALRLQGAFLSSEEVQRVVDYIKENNEAVFDSSVAEYINNAGRSQESEEVSESDDAIDPVYIEALRYVVAVGQASISMIQRRCGVGYNRAGKIIEWMEAMGYISPFEGAKARRVILTKEEFEAKYGSEDEI